MKNNDIPLRQIWKLAFPIILSLLAQNLVNVTDTAFLSRVGVTELGASAIAGVYYMVFYMLGFGFSVGLQIIIARRNGERAYARIGPVVENGIFFLLLLAMVLIVVSRLLTPMVLPLVLASDELVSASSRYLNIRILGLLFSAFNMGFRALHIGRKNTGAISVAAFLMAGSNVLLDYLLIFGKWGFPRMGLEGAAWASVAADAISALYFVLQASHRSIRRHYALYRFAPLNMQLIRHILNISIYTMLQYFVSISTWLTFFLVIEKTGEANLASSNIVRSLYGLIAIPTWAFGSIMASLTGNVIGAGRSDKVFPLMYKVATLGFFTALATNLPVALFPGLFLSLFTSDPAMATLTLPSMYVVLGAHQFLAVGLVIFNVVSGTGKTQVAMWIELGVLAIYVVTLLALAHYFPTRPEMIWYSEWVYWLLLGFFAWLYLRTGRWRRARV
ncbi:MAG: MATE family efflux transporter [Bacteroidales bacterium]